MSKILLVHPGLIADDATYYTIMPMGIVSIGDKLLKDGHEVKILNVALEKKKNKNFSFEEYLENFSPDFVGIDMQWYPYIYDSMLYAEISKRKGAKIILGGFNASIFAKDIIDRFNFIDGVIVGEAEIPFSELVKSGIKEDIPNLVYRDRNGRVVIPSKYINSSEVLDELDFYNFDLIESKDYYLSSTSSTGNYIITNSSYIPKKLYFLFLGRGCYKFCSYCSANVYNFSKFGIKKPVFRSPRVVVQDILRLQNMGVDMLHIEFDPHPFSERFYRELLDEIRWKRFKIDLGINIGFWAGGLPHEDIIKGLAQVFPSKISVIELSPESADQRIRRLNGRGDYSNEDLVDNLLKIKKNGFHACVYFFCGLPFETEKDVNKTIDFAKYLRQKDIGLNLFVPSLEPGSPMWLHPNKYGVKIFRKTFEDFLYHSFCLKIGRFPEHPIGYETNFLSEKKIMELEMEAYSKIYLDLRYIMNRFKHSLKVSDNIYKKIKVSTSILFKNYKGIWEFKKT